MSTTSIQAQSGYTAQASPIPAVIPVSSERSLSVTPGPQTPDQRPPFPQAPLPQNASLQQNAQKPISNAPAPEANREPSLNRTTRKTDVDWRTNELVYRVIDSRSGQVVSQSPDDAILRLRAYAKQALTQTQCGHNAAQTVSRDM